MYKSKRIDQIGTRLNGALCETRFTAKRRNWTLWIRYQLAETA